MRILFFGGTTRKGLTYHLVRLAVALHERGHAVFVCSNGGELVPGLKAELANWGIPDVVLPRMDELTPWGILATVKGLGMTLRRTDFDVVHVQGMRTAWLVWAALRLAQVPNTRLIVTHHRSGAISWGVFAVALRYRRMSHREVTT